jgi:hypothetical protein
MWSVLAACLCVLGVLVWMWSTETRLDANTNRHLTADYSYAHFSSITSSNYLLTPSLLLTHPHRFRLTAGQSLWIPRGWWHWVRTTGPSVAVNVWMPERVGASPIPYRLTSFSHPPALLDALDAVAPESTVWDSRLDILVRRSHLSRDNQYIMTLEGWDQSDRFKPANGHLRQVARQHATIPPGGKVNVWMSKGYHDTGLHYDDDDGILSVLRGVKDITLYPPTDTPYLRPLSLLPRWATQRPTSVSYNIYAFRRTLPASSLPSARLLYESITRKAVLREVTRLHHEAAGTPLVWGCKLEAGVLRWELYAYHYNLRDVRRPNPGIARLGLSAPAECLIHSIDLYDRDDPVGPDIHYYYKDSPGLDFPVSGRATTGRTTPEGVFQIDTAEGMRTRFRTHAKSIGFEDTDINACTHLVSQYACRHMALWNKYKHQLYIQYLGISVEDFLHFLREHAYPPSLIAHVAAGGYEEIEHEITIVYDLKTLLPVRSGFYGIV